MEKNYQSITIPVDGNLGVAHSRLFGTNLEHTRGSVYGGLSAQMLKNRKFVGCPSAMEGVAVGWYPIGEETYAYFHGSYTHHDREHYHMHRLCECNAQGIMNPTAGALCGIGQHELTLVAGKTYEVAVVAKATENLTLSAALTDRWGKKILGKADWRLTADTDWARYTALLTLTEGDPDGDLRITFEEEGIVEIGAVSLMDHDNFRGMRSDVVACLKETGIRVLRWPGGNFAGEYNWFDGLLPVDERAPLESYMHLETQPHSLGYDFHEINTDDFIALCREVGAEPYITINPVWNTPEENAAWVEYCNGDENTSYGRLRIERGFAEPYNVKLWSLGNEMGYAHMEGENTPDWYAKVSRQHAEAMLAVCPDLELCSSGPHPNEDWIEHTVKPLADTVNLVSLHMYTVWDACMRYARRDEWEGIYRDCVEGIRRGRELARTMRDLLGDCPTRVSFDEWNVWQAWRRPSSVMDGIFTVGMLHMLMAEAEPCHLGVSCQFELVNESGVKVTPTEAFLTATGQAFAIMKPHQEGTILSASDDVVATEKDGVVTVTVINFSMDEPRLYALDCGREVAEATLYEGKSIAPRSYFEPRGLDVQGGKFEIPAHSVARIQYRR